MLEDEVDATTVSRLKSAKIEFHFASSAGRSDVALLLQCYGAAALADVTGGVLLDPQEAGATHGAEVYAVAKANSDWVFAQAPAATQRIGKSWWRRMFGL